MAMQCELLVYGYCRMATKYVPLDIALLCASYFEFDEWDATHSSINYKINRKLLTRQWNYDRSRWCNAFGCKAIKPHGHINNYHVWKLQIAASDIGSVLCLFGVVCSDRIKTKNVNLSEAKYVSRVGNLAINDIVTLTLDLTKQDNGKLTYAINKRYLGVIFDHIDTDLEWTLAVSVPHNVQLLLCTSD
eukprot:471643_1